MSACSNGDSSGYVAQNRDFHFLLYSSSQTQVLLPLIESVWLQTGPFMRVVYGRIGTSFVVDQHKAAIEALKASGWQCPEGGDQGRYSRRHELHRQ